MHIDRSVGVRSPSGSITNPRYIASVTGRCACVGMCGRVTPPPLKSFYRQPQPLPPLRFNVIINYDGFYCISCYIQSY